MTDAGAAATGGVVAAVDLGATSGRVMLGSVGAGMVRLEEVSRFANGPVPGADGSLHWDFTALRAHIVAGLTEALRREPSISSIGIDSWAVDYGVIEHDALRGEPFHYRDERTADGVQRVHAEVPFEQLYRRNGLQFLPFNTLYQLAIERGLDSADEVLLIPDLVAWLLTGAVGAERTNASTTGLLQVHGGAWDLDLAARIGLRADLLPPLVEPGDTVGTTRVDGEDGIGAAVPVVAVGSHDTASAVVAVPMTDPRTAAYISCGTWGLVGLELDAPVVTDAARAANFTNEGGVDSRIRFLHNVTGLWLLSESVRAWEAETGEAIALPSLLAEAAAVTGEVPIFDANDPRLSAPGDMPARIGTLLREAGLAVPEERAAMTRTIVESIAAAFADAVRTAAALSGRRRLEVIHIVGGGSLNSLLCQSTADRSGLPVLAGPVEATALGNVLVQARSHGWFGPDASLETLRSAVRAAVELQRFDPR